MKQVNFPVIKAQKDFEDLAKTLLSVMAELPTEKQIEILEFAYKVDSEDKYEQSHTTQAAQEITRKR